MLGTTSLPYMYIHRTQKISKQTLSNAKQMQNNLENYIPSHKFPYNVNIFIILMTFFLELVLTISSIHRMNPPPKSATYETSRPRTHNQRTLQVDLFSCSQLLIITCRQGLLIKLVDRLKYLTGVAVAERKAAQKQTITGIMPIQSLLNVH